MRLKDVKAAREIWGLPTQPPKSISAFIGLYSLGYLVLDSNLDLNFLSHLSRREIQSVRRYTLSLKSKKKKKALHAINT